MKSRVIVTWSTVEKPGDATPPIFWKNLQAFRLPAESSLESQHEEYPELKDAIAKYPSFPWQQISVLGGEPIEPELLEAINATSGV